MLNISPKVHTMKNQYGLTLIELLVTLVVISVLIALAAPQFGTITSGSKQASAANALVTDIAYARNEAVTRNSDVTIAAKSGDWKNGWTVTTKDSSGTTIKLRDNGAVPAGVSINPTGVTSLTYKADGSQSSGPATITFCNSNLPANNNSGMQIEIKTVTGRQTLNSNVNCP